MSLSESLSSAAGYTRRFFDNAGELLLVYLMAIVGWVPVLNFFYLGYQGRVITDSSGSNRPPRLERVEDMFVDGAKYFLAGLIWAIPVILIIIISVVLVFIPVLNILPSGNLYNATFWQSFNSTNWGQLFQHAYTTNTAAAAVVPVIILLALIAIFITIFALVGIVHMFKTKSFGKAFAVGEIFSIISKIGWLRYLGLLVVAIILLIISSVFNAIPVLGYFISAFLGMLILIFVLRTLGLMYDSAMGKAPSTTAPATPVAMPPPPPPAYASQPSAAVKYCTACGAANPADAFYCNKCGTKLQ